MQASILTIVVPIHGQGRNPTISSEAQRQKLLDSLAFEQLEARQMTIKTVHAKTCKWLLKDEGFLQWQDATKFAEHHGFLWIKGKAGTGKSTLMKFALVNARRTMKNHLILSFFFNARGEGLEKSTTGAYRSLLYQLLKHLPRLRSVFDSLGFLPTMFRADHKWTNEELQMLLEQAIWSLGDSPVLCFIDALDECDEEEVREMIQFFEHIGDLALSKNTRFQVCFSSRHYPHITIRSGLELVLEGQEGHTQDITNYIEAELKIEKNKTAQNIRAELQKKASGIFMWVVLVVGILNKESDRGQNRKLQQKLREIPGDLHELFRDILTRDTHNKQELILCIQWILFARKPLNPEQLYHAILSGIEPEAMTEWDPEEATPEVIQRFILNTSKGLAETTVSKERSVQFIHESVRDFLLKDNGLGKVWPDYEDKYFRGESHDQLKQCCLNYMDFVMLSTVFGDEHHTVHVTAGAERESAIKRVPFLEYAVRNILHHADTAAGDHISQADFLANIQPSKWVMLDNMFDKYRQHTGSVTLLYLLAEYNLANLIRASAMNDQVFEVGDERYGCPLLAAAAMNSRDVLDVFLTSVNTQRAAGVSVVRTELQQSWQPAQRTIKRTFVYSKSKGLVQNALEIGNDEFFARLIISGRFNTKDRSAKGENPPDFVIRDPEQWPLSARALVNAGATLDNVDKSGHTSLYLAAEAGNMTQVELLLELGADVNAQSGLYGNALKAALYYGHTEVVGLLIRNGADVNAQGGDYGNALQAASNSGKTDVVRLLLGSGADVNAQGGYYGNALQAASRSKTEIVRLLLDSGADVNAQGGFHGNALQAASNSGKTDVVRLLLDSGADVNAQGGELGTALQAAARTGRKDIVQLLLDNSADVNTQGGRYGSALQAALAPIVPNAKIVELLEKAGAVRTLG